MKTHQLKSSFSQRLLNWFFSDPRPAPWRLDRDPYRIWISEVMLQQTQWNTVIPYFERFIKRYPDLKTLALADEDELLRYWQGLGYYQRARNLRKAAGILCEEYGGSFPNTADQLSKLPGFGPYISAALASQAFGEKLAAVDGNLKRVYMRIFAENYQLEKRAQLKIFRERIESLMEEDPGNFNQASMELGARVCLPQKPICSHCPVSEDCRALQTNRVLDFPKTKAKNKKATEELTAILAYDVNRRLYYIEKRPSKGLLAGLYQFKLLPGHYDENTLLAHFDSEELEIISLEKLDSIRHIFSHKIWDLEVYRLQLRNPDQQSDFQPGDWCSAESVHEKAMPAFFAEVRNRYLLDEP